MSNRVRPLSPHLTIYRWPITMILSILHRGTGIVLTLGLLSFSLWLGSIALGEDHYKRLLGRLFIKIYYLISPNIAKLISKNSILKKITKSVLDRFISIINKNTH